MKSRTAIAERNSLKILETVIKLWNEHSINDISLELVAKHSGTTVRTILRKFETREGMLKASIAFASSKIVSARDMAPVGNLHKSLEVLLSEYEATGDAVLRTIMLQDTVPMAKEIIQGGFRIHRAWCQRVFAPFLPSEMQDNYETELAAYICATEIYLWKLLRRDLNKSYKQTFAVFYHMLQSLSEKSKSI